LKKKLPLKKSNELIGSNPFIDDGLVRVVDVQTNYGIFRRAITKLGRTNAEIHVETEVQHRWE
jgi:hypothetical protein